MSNGVSLEELASELQLLEAGAASSLNDEELIAKVRSLHAGFEITTPCLPIGTAIYRAVSITQRPRHKSRVSYAPPEYIVANGRLNRAGQAMFYGSFSPFPCLMECGWEVGNFFAVSGWLTTRDMLFNHLGFSTATLEAHKSNRPLPDFVKEFPDPRNRLLREWQARVFTQHVPKGEEERYRLPIALRNFALSDVVQINPDAPPLFSGVIYPSVAFHLLADNVAILPSEVDANLALFEVMLVTLDRAEEVRHSDGRIETKQHLKAYDSARPDNNGNLCWGQKSQIVYPEGVEANKIMPRLLPPE